MEIEVEHVSDSMVALFIDIGDATISHIATTHKGLVREDLIAHLRDVANKLEGHNVERQKKQ